MDQFQDYILRMTQSRFYSIHMCSTCQCVIWLPSFNFPGIPQRATQYSLPWVWRALRDNAAALSTTIPLKWDNRGEVKSSFPSVPPFTPPAHHPIFTLPALLTPTPSPTVSPGHRETIRHSAATSHSLLWTRHVTSLHYTSLFRSLSLCLLFCYSLACSFSPMPPPLLPLCTVWGMVYEHRDLVSHPESWTKTRTYGEIFAGCVTLTHRSPMSSSLQPWWFFCQMLSCFPPRSTCFIHLSRWQERGHSSQIWNGIYTHIRRHELVTLHTHTHT